MLVELKSSCIYIYIYIMLSSAGILCMVVEFRYFFQLYTGASMQLLNPDESSTSDGVQSTAANSMHATAILYSKLNYRFNSVALYSTPIKHVMQQSCTSVSQRFSHKSLWSFQLPLCTAFKNYTSHRHHTFLPNALAHTGKRIVYRNGV